VNENFDTVESAIDLNAADIAASKTNIASNTEQIASNESGIAANAADIVSANSRTQQLEARVATLEEQVQILLDNLVPPARVVVDGLGVVLTPTPGVQHIWNVSGFDFIVAPSIPDPDPLTPREDLPVELEGFPGQDGLATCSPAGPSSVYVVDVIPITPGAGTSFSSSNAGYIDAYSSLTVNLNNLTFVQSFAPNVGDTGVPAQQISNLTPDRTPECNPIGTIFLQADFGVSRFDLYTSPIISIGGLLNPPYTSVVP
jgi:hypothetical protein